MTSASVAPAVTGMVTTKRRRRRGALLAWLVLLLATGGCSFLSPNRGIEFLGTEDVVLQRGRTDCGIAALATLSLFLGTPKTLDELENGMSLQELSMLDLRNLAARHGIALRGVFARPTGSARLLAPWIAHVETPAAHYVVVTSSHGSGWIVADPAAGVFRYTDEALRRRWSGRALIVDGTIRPVPSNNLSMNLVRRGLLSNNGLGDWHAE